MDIDKSYVPQKIKEKIEELNDLLREAEELSEEITKWYHEALLDMEPELDDDNELFDATNPLLV